MHLLQPFRAIEAGALGQAGYARLLTALHAYHCAVADAAEQAGLGELSSSARRCEALERDLDCLDTPRQGEASSPGDTRGSSNPAFAGLTKEALLGALYVAEGSMLGGRVIARQLDYLFGDAAEGRSFFLGTREDDARWRRLLGAVEEANDNAETLRAMIAGAEGSFAHFGECIGTHG